VKYRDGKYRDGKKTGGKGSEEGREEGEGGGEVGRTINGLLGMLSAISIYGISASQPDKAGQVSPARPSWAVRRRIVLGGDRCRQMMLRELTADVALPRPGPARPVWPALASR